MGLGEAGASQGKRSAEMTVTMIVLGLSALYALARGLTDLLQRRYLWGATRLLCGGLLLLAPIATHAVKLDLP